MNTIESRVTTHLRKLSELRGQLELAVQKEDLVMQRWWDGVLFGRLWELEASGVFTTDERKAFEAEMNAAFNKSAEDMLESVTGRRRVLPT